MNKTLVPLDALTPEQQRLLADRLREILRIGFGEITLVVRHGEVKFIQVKHSEELPRSQS